MESNTNGGVFLRRWRDQEAAQKGSMPEEISDNIDANLLLRSVRSMLRRGQRNFLVVGFPRTDAAARAYEDVAAAAVSSGKVSSPPECNVLHVVEYDGDFAMRDGSGDAVAAHWHASAVTVSIADAASYTRMVAASADKHIDGESKTGSDDDGDAGGVRVDDGGDDDADRDPDGDDDGGDDVIGALFRRFYSQFARHDGSKRRSSVTGIGITDRQLIETMQHAHAHGMFFVTCSLLSPALYY